MRYSIIILATILVACPSHPTPPNEPDVVVTPDDDGDASDLDGAKRSQCLRACSHLKTLGCPEGADPNCEPVCSHAQGTLTDLHTNCLINAKSKDDARACKSVRCQ